MIAQRINNWGIAKGILVTPTNKLPSARAIGTLVFKFKQRGDSGNC
jgi:hypothetical protein